MKYAFYVSGQAGRLKLYLESIANQQIESELAFILIDNIDNDELRDMCNKMQIPFYEYSYKNMGLKGKEQNRFISDKLLELLLEFLCSCCFVFGSRILEGSLLDKYHNKLINFHPSLLPSFKGVSAIDQALEANALLLGNTAHIVDKELDNGPIIMQSILPRAEYTDYNQVLNMQIAMIHQIRTWIEQDRFKVIDNRVVIDNASYQIDKYIPNLEIKA